MVTSTTAISTADIGVITTSAQVRRHVRDEPGFVTTSRPHDPTPCALPDDSQVGKQRDALRGPGVGLGGVDVGTVSNFQGKEKKVIVVSTVYTQHPSKDEAGSMLDHDKDLSFFSRSRIHVAVSRVKALLVVVGHPAVLETDEIWKDLLDHCRNNNSYYTAAQFEVRMG